MKALSIVTHITAVMGLMQVFQHWIIAMIGLMFMSSIFSVVILRMIYKKSYTALKESLPAEKFVNEVQFYYCLHMLINTYLLIP